MDKRFLFISGLPRSGSTLTSAILRQNPRVYAGVSGPVSTLFDSLIGSVSVGNEVSSMVTDVKRENLLRGLFTSYYADVDKELIFDTNRAWTAQLSALMRLFPETRLICCVRSVAWILDSLERQYRNNAFEHTGLFNNGGERSTVYTRVEALTNANRLVGFAWQALKEACYSDFADRLLLIEYDVLVEQPEQTINLIYEFIGEEPYAHDFNNVEFDAPELDVHIGLSGMHKVKPVVQPMQRKTILPPDLFERYNNLSFWRNLPDSSALRLVVSDDIHHAQQMPGGAA
ncbi:sulfotransferase family protein [Alterisphingorhabdus coralli]|uniref:Sulfotransferase n=1 Tax=Alterisphingorhabdus coralli TaxID=3071408 RepID=A0AA97F841_9SPHN|nr:sulfotransferase [Parasphingorhabdus sp. SCSIO 66989]WOE75037.1 sulfotransferase [Parasphingorhabdus sp. SCSIO 66989]